MIRYAYTAWDETPGTVALAPDAILEALTNDLLHYGDLNRALSEELRRDQTAPDGTASDGTAALQGCADLHQPLQLEALLQQAGLIRRTAEGLRLTPQGARQIGANTQAGLRLARTLLGRQHTTQKHILLITDGRPTAAYLNGQLHLHTRGLHPVIIEETYKEAKRCRDQEITLNTFMLADEEPLVHFVKRLTAISQGRAFYTTPERLGHYVLEDYIRRR